MRIAKTAIAAAIAGFTASTWAASQEADQALFAAPDILDLTADTFASTVDPESLILVEFYAPWCGHCQKLAPELSSAATTLKAEGIKVAKVDCTVSADLCTEQDVGGYPTLKVFRKGSATEYNGPRKADGIVSYMQKQSLPAVSVLDASTIDEFKTKDRLVVVGFLTEGSEEKTLFDAAAEKFRESHLFGSISDEAAAKAAGVSAPAIVLYRTFDEPEVKYPGKFDEEALDSFILTESVPLIDEVGPDNFMTYAEAGLPLAYYFTEPEATNKETVLAGLKPLAKANKGKVNFVWIDAVKFVNHAKGLNLKGDEWPAFAIQDINAGTKFPLDNLGKDPVKTIGDFVKQYTAGKLSPSIKSEPVPKSQDEPVFILVADEFDKVIYDDKKDVLVEFYAPWCGHCKNLAPIYDKLAQSYSGSKDKLVIAKMDATANDIPPSAGFQVQSFPTIKFKAAGSKEFTDYDGPRTHEGFVDFIGLHAKNKVAPVETTNDTAAAGGSEAGEAHRVHEEL